MWHGRSIACIARIRWPVLPFPFKLASLNFSIGIQQLLVSPAESLRHVALASRFGMLCCLVLVDGW